MPSPCRSTALRLPSGCATLSRYSFSSKTLKSSLAAPVSISRPASSGCSSFRGLGRIEFTQSWCHQVPSGYRRHAAQRRDPNLRCAWTKRDEVLVPEIERVWQATMQVYGADKVWRQLRREGTDVARCNVERLMRRAGLRGVMRGKVVRTAIGNAAAPCPLDRVNRQFKAQRPNQLLECDFTYVSTWQGFVYVAFVIDVFARRILGWRVSSSMRTDFVLDAVKKRFTTARRNAMTPCLIIATETPSTSLSATVSGSPKPVLNQLYIEKY